MIKKKKKILLVCTMGLNRSKYLAEYLEKLGYETRHGGIGPCRVDPQPANPISRKDVEWADVIVAARKKHEPILLDEYGAKDKKIIILNVTDSRKKMGELYSEFKNIDQREFNKRWTYPQLEKAIKPYLPL